MMVLRCAVSMFDWIFTVTLLYALFLADVVFTYRNLKALSILYPKRFLKYEMNRIILWLIMKYGIENAFAIYFWVGFIFFTILTVWLPIHAGILVGFMIALVLLVHIPNYIELKKRLKKRARFK